MPVAVNRHRQPITLDPHPQSGDIARHTFVLREVSADDNPRGVVNISVQRRTPVPLAQPFKEQLGVTLSLNSDMVKKVLIYGNSMIE